MEFNKDNLLEVAKNGIYYASGNASLTCTQMAFTVTEHIIDEFNVDAKGGYDSLRSEYSVTIPATVDRPGHLITWRFVRRDAGDNLGEYYPVIEHRHLDHQGNKDVAKEYDTIAAAMQKDSDYLWSWFANVAVTLGDHSNLTGYECAVAAAALLQHLWKVDITSHPHYIEQLKRTRPSSHAITHDEAFKDPDTNHVYVNVTGFGPNSGATAFAKRINQALKGQGFASFLHVADTSLSQDEVSEEVQGNTVFSITAVESRTNTDNYGDPDVVDVLEAGDPDPGNDLDSEEGPDADEFDNDDGSIFGEGEDPDQGFAIAGFASPTHELEVELQNSDLHPLLTIRYFQDNLPGTVVKAKYQVDPHLTDAIHKMYLEPEDKTLKITLDPEDPDAPGTVAMIQSAVLEQVNETCPLLKALDYKPTLNDPEFLKNAYVFQMDGADEFCVLHVDIDSPEFDIDVFHRLIANGVNVVPTTDMGWFIKGLEKHAPSALDHLETLVKNNRRWDETFQSWKAWGDDVNPTPVSPFTLYNLPQNAIPKSIYDLVESCWIDWQQTVKLEDLSREIGDPSVIINFDQYVTKTQGGFMVVREHPRLEELFLKLLKVRARNNPTLAVWLKLMGH